MQRDGREGHEGLSHPEQFTSEQLIDVAQAVWISDIPPEDCVDNVVGQKHRILLSPWFSYPKKGNAYKQ